MANKEIHQQGDSTKHTDATNAKAPAHDAVDLLKNFKSVVDTQLDYTKAHLPDVLLHDSHKLDVSVNKDGGVTIHNADGSSSTLKLDGSRVEQNKDGNVTDVDHGHGKGTEHIDYGKDGKPNHIKMSDGQDWTKNPDGKTWNITVPGKAPDFQEQTYKNQRIDDVSVDPKTGDLSWTNNKDSKDMKHPEEHRKVTADGTYIQDTNKLPLEPIPSGEGKVQDQMVLNEAKTIANVLDLKPPQPNEVNAALEALNKLGPEYAKKVHEAMTEPEKSRLGMVDVLQADGSLKSQLMVLPELKPALPELPDFPIGPGGKRPPDTSGGIMPPDIGPQDGNSGVMPPEIT